MSYIEEKTWRFGNNPKTHHNAGFDRGPLEITQMRTEQDALLHEPTPQAARNFMHKWNEGEGAGMSDNIIMVALYKLRVRKGIDVDESTEWLTSRGYKTEIIYHGEPL